MFLQRLEKPRQQKFFQSTFTATLLLMAGITAIAQEPVSKEQIDDKFAEVVKLGEAIVENTTTHPVSKGYVGNALNCTSCHLDNGRHEKAGSVYCLVELWYSRLYQRRNLCLIGNAASFVFRL